MGENNIMKHKLQSKIKRFQQYLDELIPYTILADNELLDQKNKEKLYTAERLFQLLVDEAIDINTELIQLKGNRVPDTYHGTFSELPSIGIFERVFTDTLSGSVKVRNHIVHEYEDMKRSEVVRHIKRYSEMYKEYIKEIIRKTL